MPIVTFPGSRPRPKKSPSQCQRPAGWVGRLVIRMMNRRHSEVTDWGLGHLSVGKREMILDIGCGGGRTVRKLAGLAPNGRVHGIDYSPTSVAAARKVNQDLIQLGRISIAEFYNGGKHAKYAHRLAQWTTMAILDVKPPR